MTRFLTLYVRSRRVPAALAAIVAASCAVWALGLITENPAAEILFAALGAAIGAAVLGPGLVGSDPELDRTGAIPWPPRRAAHVLAGGTLVGAALVAMALTGEPITDTSVLLRNAAGLTGLVALTAALFGTNFAWVPPVAWTAVTIMAGGQSGAWWKQAGTWLAQPDGNKPAITMAAGLAVAGLAAYALRGARR